MRFHLQVLGVFGLLVILGTATYFFSHHTLANVTNPCGSGKMDSTKQCDDGVKNGTKGDPCSKTCTWIQKCGDGRIETILATSHTEDCDDGNTKNGDGCTSKCKVEKGWACWGAPSLCKKIVCGDGFLEWTKEPCDPGNKHMNGCTSKCHVATGWRCYTDATGSYPVTSMCQGACGDGSIEAGEECDDGPNNGRDGRCSTSCKICASPSACSSARPNIGSYCGNGIIDAGEACDDAQDNGTKGDLCTKRCTLAKK